VSPFDWTVAQLVGGQDLPGKLVRTDGVSEQTLTRMLSLMGRQWRGSAEIGWMLKCHTSSANRLLRVAMRRGLVERMVQYRRT